MTTLMMGSYALAAADEAHLVGGTVAVTNMDSKDPMQPVQTVAY